jgi:hypothetical protein
MHKVLVLLAHSQPALGAIKWTTSTTNLADSTCIVSGSDAAEPGKAFVGGPCSQLDVSDPQNIKIQAGFRWVEMASDFVTWDDFNGPDIDMYEWSGSRFIYSKDEVKYAEAGRSAAFFASSAQKWKTAGLRVSQTSHLIKASIESKTAEYAFNKVKGTVLKTPVCVTPCCTSHHGCRCSQGSGQPFYACTGNANKAKPGDLGLHLFLAAFDASPYDPAFGWEGMRADIGVTSSNGMKQLTGEMWIKQVIDFANMQADPEVISSSTSTIKYNDMTEWDTSQKDQNTYSAAALILQSANWNATYRFPQLYFGGRWTDAMTPEGKQLGTGKMKLHCMKPSKQALVNMKIAANLNAAAQMKVLLLGLRFDVTGISGARDSGMWYAYNPTVNTDNDGSLADGVRTALAGAVDNSTQKIAISSSSVIFPWLGSLLLLAGCATYN